MADSEEISGVVITLFSTASAVGKTLISINMASELAREGFTVCLLDMDLQFGDVANYLNLHPEYTLSSVQGCLKLDSGLPVYEYLTEYSYGDVIFHVLPAPTTLSEAYNIDPSICEKIVQSLRKVYDYIIIDTTSMFSVLNMKLLDLSTIVTFLGIVDFLPTIRNMKNGNDTLRGLGYDDHKIRLVLNRSDSKSQISIDDVEDVLGEQFYHILPNDFRAASSSIKNAVPVVLDGKNSDFSRALRKLVSLYTNRSVDYNDGGAGGEREGGWLSKFF